MPASIKSSASFVAAAILSSAASAQIGNWDIIYQSLDTDFQDSVDHEITLDYRIGTGRAYNIDLFTKGCNGPITGMTVVPTPMVMPKITNDHDGLIVMLDLDKSAITSSNVWSGNMLEMCVRVQLTLAGSVIKEDKRDIDIAFDFSVDVATDQSVTMQTASMTSGYGQANVDSYVSAFKCDDIDSFALDNSAVTPDSILNLCIQSMDADVEIAYITNLELFQANTLGNQTLSIIDGLFLQNPEISAMNVKNATSVGVATVIPSRFFSYSGVSTAIARGQVQVEFVGSRLRHLISFEYEAAPNALSPPARTNNYKDVAANLESGSLWDGVKSARAMRGETVERDEDEAFEIPLRMERHDIPALHISPAHNSGAAGVTAWAVHMAGAIGLSAWTLLW